MDVTQLTELRSWATRLEDASSEELRAAGRAVRLLVAEVESLQSKLVEAQAGAPSAPVDAPSAEPDALPPTDEEAPGSVDPPWAAADERTHGSFRSRVKKSLGFD